MNPKDRLAAARLYAIFTEAASVLPPEEALAAAMRGGADIIQIREKGSRARRIELARLALKIAARHGAEVGNAAVTPRAAPGAAADSAESAGVLVIVNDDPEAAVEAGAHGAHIGPEDMDPAAARAILEPGMILGLSTTTLDDALAAVKAGSDYIGVGTVFPTDTKTGKTIIGPEAAARVAQAVAIPTFPIGGIDREGARLLAQAGIDRAAVCSAVFGGKAVADQAAAIRRALLKAQVH
jgi:thiamine-phosphate diphosphorylase